MPFPQTDTNYPLYLPDGSVIVNPLNVQTGGYVVPDAGVIARHVQDVNATQLNPTSLYTVVGQASKPNLILVSNPTGCDKPTMQEMPGIIPPVTMQLVDSYGIDIPGAFSTTPGSSIQVLETTPGHPTALGTQGADNTRLPFLTDVYLLAPLKSLPYGMYPFTLDGKTYPSLGTPDPTVNKPEYYLDFDPAHLYVNALDQLSIITDGNAGAYAAGQGIKFVPGDSPSTAPGIVVNAGGSVDVGPHFYWYSWTYPAAVGTVDSALSPSAYAKTDTGHKSVDVSTPAKPVGSAATGLKIWRTSVADPNTPKLLTTIGATGAQTYTDTTADSGLGAAHVVSQTQIAARPDLVTIGFDANGNLKTLPGVGNDVVYTTQPPSVADNTIPAGHISFGPWASLTPDATHFGNSGNWRQVWDPFNGQLRQTIDASIWFTFDETKLDGTDSYDAATQGYDLITAWARKFDTSGNQFFYDLWNVWMSLGPGGYDPGTDSVGDADWDLWQPLWIGMDLSGPFAAYSVTAEIPSTLTGDLFVAKHGSTTVWKVHTDGTVTSGPFAATTGSAVDGTATSGKGVSGTASTGIPLYGNLTGAGTRILRLDNAGTEVAGFDNNGTLIMSGATTTTTPAAGGAGALPATPLGYISVVIAGTTRQLAYY